MQKHQALLYILSMVIYIALTTALILLLIRPILVTTDFITINTMLAPGKVSAGLGELTYSI